MLRKLTYKLISEIGVKEKYVRKDHYNTIKVWWARRPVAAMRSLLIREVLHRNKESGQLADEQLFSAVNPPAEAFDLFSDKYKTKELSVLDVFAGGGSIPFESARLKFRTFSAELNPVASLLQETIFNSVRIENYPEKLKQAGHRVVDRVEKRIGKYFFIDGVKPHVLFWSKVASCKSCGEDIDLRRIEYLSKRRQRPVRIFEEDGELILLNNFGKEEGLKKEFICKVCGASNSFKDIKEYCKGNRFKYSPFAMCYHSGGKKYKILADAEKKVLGGYSKEIQREIGVLSYLLPTGGIKLKSGVINPTLYDLQKPADFFSDRQLLSLLTVIDEIAKEYVTLNNSFGESEAVQIVLGLSSLIEFLVDWNSVGTMWIAQNEQTGRSLAGPGVGMKWDFIEINPFAGSGSNLLSKVDRVSSAFKAIQFDQPIHIIKGSSTSLPLQNDSIDIVLTDPPYYDSVDYTGLSEFFRPWLESLLRVTFSEHISLKNEDGLEAIVDMSKKSVKDHDHYQSVMTGVLKEVKRVLKNDGSALLLYSHKTFEGWKVIADSFVGAGLFVTDCIPVEIERIARPRAMAYDALNGVIVFRLTKANEGIRSIRDDIAGLKDLFGSGEILDSQVVIYLAALAVKEVSLSGKSYKDAYEEVIMAYEKVRLEDRINNSMDMITQSYLMSRLRGTLKGLEDKYFEVLLQNDLVLDSRLKTMDEIRLDGKAKDTILETALLVYNDFKFNSKTRISFNAEQKDNLMAFYSIVGGVQLNTMSRRTSNPEIKVARLVLSKSKGG